MKILYIEWFDASETEKYLKDVAIPDGQGLGLSAVSSVGILVEETKEYISLATSLSSSGWYMGIINIPKVGIRSDKVLSE